jgi:microcystin-dependent protein
MRQFSNVLGIPWVWVKGSSSIVGDRRWSIQSVQGVPLSPSFTGDGSTTCNIPDCRGRVIAGKDDMGGTSANRLTNQSGGLNGDTLGAMGGSETHTLTEAQLPTITPAGTNSHVPAHRHFVANGDSGAFSSLMNSNQLNTSLTQAVATHGHYQLQGASTDATIGRTSEVAA